ncbi:MAG: ABC transporter permease [Winogradskyella sp.]|uniref:ABC transporter permease n=1 Tax=Winogradskyella sp. TaxID=1883156 RepID=UPI0025E63B7F|nr:ABC transporter permease [Winogradskyella sp.]NRB84880.1 ABC transporter permease [Winogradskyella sp.]
MSIDQKGQWLYIISSKKKLIDLNLQEIWRYRDLLILFVKRDIVTLYKQTVLGPLWYLIQPILTSVIFTIIFNGIANINVGDGIHPFLFNLAGISIWNYFSECLKATSDTFKKNEQIFNKVYFPRVIMPMSKVVSGLLKFGIQGLIFLGFYLYFSFSNLSGELNGKALLFFPILVAIMGLLGLAFGMVISSMTTKYRDLTFLVGFGTQLLMYLSAVVYPTDIAISKLSNNFPGAARIINPVIENNPLAKVVESFRYMFFSQGSFSIKSIMITFVLSVVLFLIGLIIFNKTEKSFVDTI